MPEIDTHLSADSSPATPPVARSTYTPRALLLVGILCSIPGLAFMTAMMNVLLNSPRLPLSLSADDAVWMAVVSVVSLTGAALCFVRARAGYRRGYVLPLSYREQLTAAFVTTLLLSLCALSVVDNRKWSFLPIFMFNPMLFTTWLGVYLKRPRPRAVRAAASGTVTVAEKPAAGYWWTHYETCRQAEESRSDDRITLGKR